jgi:hypothetical protein
MNRLIVAEVTVFPVLDRQAIERVRLMLPLFRHLLGKSE